MPTATAFEIGVRATTELGLSAPIVGNDTTSQLGLQMGALLNSLGEDLIREHDWQLLLSGATFVGDGVTDEFDMPADFGRIVNQTLWSTNYRLPAVGSLSPQQWGWTQFGIVSVGIYYRYRIANDKIQVFPVPSAGDTFNFYYVSKNWVDQYGTGTLVDSITDSYDVPLFDKALMIKGLKLRLWGQKGFDTTALAEEYNRYVAMLKAQEQGSPVLQLSGQYSDILLNSTRNIPEGNW